MTYYNDDMYDELDEDTYNDDSDDSDDDDVLYDMFGNIYKRGPNHWIEWWNNS